MKKVNRLEVIGDNGRLLTVWVERPFEVTESLQDEGRTLKIFLKGDDQAPHWKRAAFRKGQARD